MANQIFASNHPRGMQMEQRFQHVFGKIQLAASVGSQFGGPEALNWTNILTGAVYATGSSASNATSLITVLAASTGTITATAANRFVVGQTIKFVGLTTAIGLVLNGQTAIVATASATQFTFANAATGAGTGETGMAVSGAAFFTYGLASNPVSTPVTSLAVTAASGGTPAFITVTAANNFFAGATVTFSGLGTVLGLLLNGVQFTILWANQTSFAIQSILTGSAGADTGTAIARNPCAPSSFICSSSGASGYIYQADQRNWNLYPLQGAASASLPLAKVTGAYPAGITGDLISWSAYFLKDGN